MNDLVSMDMSHVLEQAVGKKDLKLRWAHVDGIKWICNADVSRALGYRSDADQTSRFVEDKANLRTFHFVVDGMPQRGNPNLVFVNTTGVLDILSASQSEVAKTAWKEVKVAIGKILNEEIKAAEAPVTDTLALPAPAAARVLPDFTLLIADRRDQNEVTNEQKEAYGNEGVRAINAFYSAGLISEKLMEVALYDQTKDGKPVRIFDRNDAEELWAFCAFVNSMIMFPDADGKLETNDKMWKGYELTDDIFSEFVAFMCGGVTWTDNRGKGEWQGGFRNMHNLPGNKFDFIGIKNFNYTKDRPRDYVFGESLSPFEQFLQAGWGYSPTLIKERGRNLRAWQGVRLRKRSDRTMSKR